MKSAKAGAMTSRVMFGTTAIEYAIGRSPRKKTVAIAIAAAAPTGRDTGSLPVRPSARCQPSGKAGPARDGAGRALCGATAHCLAAASPRFACGPSVATAAKIRVSNRHRGPSAETARHDAAAGDPRGDRAPAQVLSSRRRCRPGEAAPGPACAAATPARRACRAWAAMHRPVP